MVKLSTGQALQSALDLALSLDETVFIAGEGVGTSIHLDPNLPTHGLLEKYGPKRIKDTPVSEAAIAGLAVGASAMGLRPVVEIMFFPFMTLASDMLVNHAAKLRYMSGGKTAFPMTVRVKAGVNFGAGCQHSHNLEAWIAHAPGLKLIFPSNPSDAKGLLLSAIFDPNPVVFVEEMLLYWMPGEVPEGDFRIPIGKANVMCSGEDCSLISYGGAVHTALRAAEILAAVVDGVVGTQLQAGLALGVAAGGGQHRGAEGLGQLDGRHADAAGAALHQQGLAGLQASAIEHVAPDGKEGLGQRRGLDVRQAIGHRQALANRCHAQLAVAAAGHQGADAVT